MFVYIRTANIEYESSTIIHFQYKTRVMNHIIIHLTFIPTIIHLMRTFDHFNILKYDNFFHTRINPYCQIPDLPLISAIVSFNLAIHIDIKYIKHCIYQNSELRVVGTPIVCRCAELYIISRKYESYGR